MKLLSCYVENFGAIRCREYKFNGGLSVFSGENGSGKTTLAEFLRAMFYGLPSVRSGSDKFNARLRYFPFSGGRFGGNVVFEAEGKVWRVERFFNKKSESRDETSIYCGGKRINVPASGIGKRFFGLNENSFVRTAFFNAELSDGDFDADALEKLGGAVKATGGANADEALAVLEKRRRSIKAARGAGGLLDRKKAEREKLCDEAARLKEIEKNLAAKYSGRAAAEAGVNDGYAPGYTANKRSFVLLIVALALVFGGAGLCVLSVAAGIAFIAAGALAMPAAFMLRRGKPRGDMNALFKSLAETDAAISADEAELERLPDILSEIERADCEIERLSKLYEILSATVYYLSEAKKRLSDRYGEPVRRAFLQYLEKFKIACGGKISVTDNLEIILESGGELHGERHLSSGQRAACNLCLRLALIDNMYAGEKPFLVLDDPFVSLDGKNLEKALKTLSEAARDIQIIYFTCKNSTR